MRALFLDLASHEKLFALVTDDRTVGSTEINDHTDEATLLPTIALLLKEAGWTFEDLTHIAAMTGPGGFMSLRVGISLANALSWSLKIPIAGIHLSDLWFYRAGLAMSSWQLAVGKELKANCQLPTAKSYLWLHSTKKNLLFVRGFGAFAKTWPEPVCITIDEFEAKSFKLQASSYIGELIDEHQKVLNRLKPLKPILPSEKVLPKLFTGCTWSNEILSPWYGRSG